MTYVILTRRTKISLLQGRTSSSQRQHPPAPIVSELSEPVSTTSTVDFARKTVYGSTDWAGAVLDSPPSGETFNFVQAFLQLPASPPTVPSGFPAGTYLNTIWVGLDDGVMILLSKPVSNSTP